ncbi:nascent polypeptide-associated complex subunit alpha, muscle-specific form-like [Meles meles]|uniref:nascent polypeptide-associated complex subunit alpha, muscle-specific form-like n=1 Tax=Meles meles TaxID=9662 RepID=UPI001E699DA8|nr:nascent polypeptide-associated complex subunit alpha, muscle-specific form-like [Meles meles]
MWTRVSITDDKGQTQASLMAGKRAQNWSQELRASRLKGRGGLLFCTEGDDPAPPAEVGPACELEVPPDDSKPTARSDAGRTQALGPPEESTKLGPFLDQTLGFSSAKRPSAAATPVPRLLRSSVARHDTRQTFPSFPPPALQGHLCRNPICVCLPPRTRTEAALRVLAAVPGRAAGAQTKAREAEDAQPRGADGRSHTEQRPKRQSTTAPVTLTCTRLRRAAAPPPPTNPAETGRVVGSLRGHRNAQHGHGRGHGELTAGLPQTPKSRLLSAREISQQPAKESSPAFSREHTAATRGCHQHTSTSLQPAAEGLPRGKDKRPAAWGRDGHAAQSLPSCRGRLNTLPASGAPQRKQRRTEPQPSRGPGAAALAHSRGALPFPAKHSRLRRIQQDPPLPTRQARDVSPSPGCWSPTGGPDAVPRRCGTKSHTALTNTPARGPSSVRAASGLTGKHVCTRSSTEPGVRRAVPRAASCVRAGPPAQRTGMPVAAAAERLQPALPLTGLRSGHVRPRARIPHPHRGRRSLPRPQQDQQQLGHRDLHAPAASRTSLPHRGLQRPQTPRRDAPSAREGPRDRSGTRWPGPTPPGRTDPTPRSFFPLLAAAGAPGQLHASGAASDGPCHRRASGRVAHASRAPLVRTAAHSEPSAGHGRSRTSRGPRPHPADGRVSSPPLGRPPGRPRKRTAVGAAGVSELQDRRGRRPRRAASRTHSPAPRKQRGPAAAAPLGVTARAGRADVRAGTKRLLTFRAAPGRGAGRRVTRGRPLPAAAPLAAATPRPAAARRPARRYPAEGLASAPHACCGCGTGGGGGLARSGGCAAVAANNTASHWPTPLAPPSISKTGCDPGTLCKYGRVTSGGGARPLSFRLFKGRERGGHVEGTCGRPAPAGPFPPLPEPALLFQARVVPRNARGLRGPPAPPPPAVPESRSCASGFARGALSPPASAQLPPLPPPRGPGPASWPTSPASRGGPGTRCEPCALGPGPLAGVPRPSGRERVGTQLCSPVAAAGSGRNSGSCGRRRNTFPWPAGRQADVQAPRGWAPRRTPGKGTLASSNFGGPRPSPAAATSLVDGLRKEKYIWLQAHLQALQLVQQEVWKPLAAAYEEKLNTSLRPHPYKIGDTVWVRRHRATNLEPRWKGPHTVLLTTPTALKVDGIAAWIHASHVKAAHPEEQTGHPPNSEWTVQRSPNPLKIRLIRR